MFIYMPVKATKFAIESQIHSETNKGKRNVTENILLIYHTYHNTDKGASCLDDKIFGTHMLTANIFQNSERNFLTLKYF